MPEKQDQQDNSDVRLSSASHSEALPNLPSGPISRAVQRMLHLGLGEFLQKAATNVLSLIGIVIVVWLAQLYFKGVAVAATPTVMAPAVTPLPSGAEATTPQLLDPSVGGILREANVHTNRPERPRQDMITYTVQPGDTVSGIADKFGLQAKTVFAANYDVLQDDPHMLKPDQSLRILPADGVYWEWLGGIPFSQWAGYFGVKPEDILNYPPNKLDPASIADPNNPNIKVGTFLIIPGGSYQYHTPGQVPLGITRSNPASAQVGGAGSCAPVSGGAVGTGTFVFPTAKHVLSGFDYSVKTNHLGIDLSAQLGDPIYAADGGVVVYAGANSYGYGNMIMIDHGTGFQTLYAHLSAIFTSCGFNVSQGETIGSAGATGHASGAHLHFEVRTLSNVINPWDVLPAP
ncbi:MAG TPA: M23 family metallopeptidase [Anaerolineales bacterium]|nr:M23 family metallopeptidase [Anaerolineales bacterium]